MERTYIMIKPDGVQRNLVGEIIARFEKKGYKLAALKVIYYSSIPLRSRISYILPPSGMDFLMYFNWYTNSYHMYVNIHKSLSFRQRIRGYIRTSCIFVVSSH